jgi:hypothetical protein
MLNPDMYPIKCLLCGLTIIYPYLRYHILVTLVPLIFLFNCKMAYKSASGVGGQPGT